MKTLLLLISLLFLFSGELWAQELYPVKIYDHWCYMDKDGNQLIGPGFRSAGIFSEGLAPVRENGLFGYIDSTGAFAIPPKFDNAQSFQNGFALVKIHGRSFIIDLSGNVLFDHNFENLSQPYRNTVIIYTDAEGLQGLLDMNGNIVLDAKYAKIDAFFNGVAVAYSTLYSSQEYLGCSVIDMEGRVVVSYGKYDEVINIPGFGLIALPEDKDPGSFDLINSTGHVIQEIRDEYTQEFEFDKQVGLLRLFRTGIPYKDSLFDMEPIKNQFQFMDHTGSIRYTVDHMNFMTPYRNNRAFGANSNGWHLINSEGRILGGQYRAISQHPLARTYDWLFHNGMEVVRNDSGWIVIDTNAEQIKSLNLLKYPARQAVFRFGDAFSFNEFGSNFLQTTSVDFIWSLQSDSIMKVEFSDMPVHHFPPQLMPIQHYEKSGVLTQTGKVLWFERHDTDTIAPINVNYKKWILFWATDKKIVPPWSFYADMPRVKSIENREKFPKGELSLVVDTSCTQDIHYSSSGPYNRPSDVFSALPLHIVNRTGQKLNLASIDYGLIIQIEARDHQGNWRDITEVTTQGCGYSHYGVTLGNGKQITIPVPRFEGGIKTSLRVKLSRAYFMESKVYRTNIYSNEFVGYINAGQLEEQTAQTTDYRQYLRYYPEPLH